MKKKKSTQLMQPSINQNVIRISNGKFSSFFWENRISFCWSFTLTPVLFGDKRNRISNFLEDWGCPELEIVLPD